MKRPTGETFTERTAKDLRLAELRAQGKTVREWHFGGKRDKPERWVLEVEK